MTNPNQALTRRAAQSGRARGPKEKTAQDGGQRHSDENGGMAWLQTGGDTLSDAALEERRSQQQPGTPPHDRSGPKEMTLQFADNQRPKRAKARTADRSRHMCAWAALQTQLLCGVSGRRQIALAAMFGAKGMTGQKKGRQTERVCIAPGNEPRTMTGATRDPPTVTDLLVDTPSQKPHWAMLQCRSLSWILPSV